MLGARTESTTPPIGSQWRNVWERAVSVQINDAGTLGKYAAAGQHRV
jgi:hypothetical protein